MNRHAFASCIATAALLLASSSAAALGALENPQSGGIETGIGAITGWHCTSRNIEVRIDGVSAGLAGAGTSRLDTAGVCGGRSDTGFSLLYNYALLQGGAHRVDVYADGVPFGSATFQVGYLGAEFLRGLASAHRIPNFPARGQGTRVVWEESKQNFVIADVVPLTSGSLVGTYAIQDIWVQDSTGLAASTLAPGFSASGTWTYRADGTYAVTFTLTGNGQAMTQSFSGTYVDGGYYINDGGAIVLVVERGDTLTLFGLSLTGTGSTGGLVISMSRSQAIATPAAKAAAAAPAAMSGGSALQAIAESVRTLMR
ncbi:MAG: hypothetical protein ACM3QY_12485 [Candidatus Levyibacteriota bacterium]